MEFPDDGIGDDFARVVEIDREAGNFPYGHAPKVHPGAVIEVDSPSGSGQVVISPGIHQPAAVHCSPAGNRHISQVPSAEDMASVRHPFVDGIGLEQGVFREACWISG